jgi:hypothetical protein
MSYHHNVNSLINYSFGGPDPDQSTAMQLVYAIGSDDNSGFFYMPSDQIDADQHPDPNYQIANGYTISSALAQYVSKTNIGYHTDSNLNIEFSIGSNTASPDKSLIYRPNADGENVFYYEPNEEISQELNADAEIATLGDIKTSINQATETVVEELKKYSKVFKIDYPGGLSEFYENNYQLIGTLPNNMTSEQLYEQGYNIIHFTDSEQDLSIQFTISQTSSEFMMGNAPVPSSVRVSAPQYMSADIVIVGEIYLITLTKGLSLQLDLTLGAGYQTDVQTLNHVQDLYKANNLVYLRVNNMVTFVPAVCYDYGTHGLLGFITDADIVKYVWDYNAGGTTQVTPTIRSIITEDSLTTILDSYASTDYVNQEIDTALEDYYTKSEIDEKIDNLETETNIDFSNQEVDGDRWKIVDNANNTIAQIDKDGLTVTKINVKSDTDNFVKNFTFSSEGFFELDNKRHKIRAIKVDIPAENS